MSTIANLLYYAALFFFAIFFSKQLINMFFLNKKENGHPQTDPQEFDRLIEQKAQFLRNTLELDAKTSPLLNSEISSRTKHKGLAQKIDTRDSRFLKGLFEDLNWGEGSELKKLKEVVENKFNYHISLAELSSFLRDLFQQDRAIDFLNKHPGIYPNLPGLIESYLFLKLSSESKIEISSKHASFPRAFALFMLLQVKSLMEIVVDLERWGLSEQLQKINGKTIGAIISKILFKAEVPYYLTLTEIEKKISLLKDQSLFLDVLPTITKNDTESALKLFGLKNIPDKEELKSLYKDLAMTCHPDRLPPASPDILKKLANQNFINLSLAYEILGKHV